MKALQREVRENSCKDKNNGFCSFSYAFLKKIENVRCLMLRFRDNENSQLILTVLKITVLSASLKNYPSKDLKEICQIKQASLALLTHYRMVLQEPII